MTRSLAGGGPIWPGWSAILGVGILLWDSIHRRAVHGRGPPMPLARLSQPVPILSVFLLGDSILGLLFEMK
jgi:hypothetical protein